MLGDIVYLYTLDLENTLAVRQELIKDRFCKIIEATKIKGSSNDEKYMQYKLESLTTKKVYIVKNYLSTYNFCNITELENSIEKVSSIINEEKLNKIYEILNEIKEA